MAVFTVTTLDDTVAADGELSLREAVTLANAASDFDTINFAAGLRGTVNLTAGRLILTQGVSITGDTNFDPATPDITIDGSGNDPYDGYTAGVFSVTNNAYARFGSLVITGGQAKSNGGGGIHTDAGTNVTVVYSVIAGNSASTSVGGGIWARGNLSISSSTISGNHGNYFGGGIAAYGDLAIVNSVISGNDAFVGGGIWFGHDPAGVTGSKLTIVSSTIAENTSGYSGGGLAILDSTSTATLIDTTVSSNHSGLGGGIYTEHRDLKIYNSTIAHNTVVPSIYIPTPVGAGMASGNAATHNTHLYNSVIAANDGAADIGVTTTGNANAFTGHYGIIGDAGGLWQDGLSGIRAGTEDAPIDPMLAPLALNLAGTFTHAILSGSPLIHPDNASANANWLPEDPYNAPNDLGFDGNLYPRVWGSGLDLGAVEFQNQWTVTSTSDSDDDGIGASALADILDGDGLSLREALNWAESGATITFAESLNGQSINLNSTLVLSKDVYIDGDINDDHIADVRIDGQLSVRLFDVGTGVNAALGGLRLYNGADFGAYAAGPTGAGGTAASAIMNRGNLTIIDSRLSNNSSLGGDGRSGSFDGGSDGGSAATIVNYGSLGVSNSVFQFNTANGGAGGSGGLPPINLAPGADGGNGGHAAAGILQLNTAPGSLVIDQVRYYNSRAYGGAGGNGGDGGDGEYSVQFGHLPPGDGGNGGVGGSAGLIVVGPESNVSGNLSFETNDYTFNAAFGGFPGNPGAASPSGPLGLTGSPGSAGSEGVLVLLTGATDAVSHLVTNSLDSGEGSLRYAIALAHEGDTIRFSKEMSGATISLLNELTITQDLNIVGDVDGDDKADITLSGRDLNRVFNISGSGTDVRLGSLTLVDGKSTGFGGAIYAGSGTQLSLLHTTVSSSSADRGAGIFNAGFLSALNSTIDHNTATSFGGGIYVASGRTFQGVNVTIAYNSAGVGGGIDTASASQIVLINSTVNLNFATNKGGGIDLFNDSDAFLTNTILSGNIASLSSHDLNVYAVAGTTANAINSILGTGVVLAASDPSNHFTDAPGLGGLFDNGGTVRTKSPLDGSLAIDAGNSASRGYDIFDLDHNGIGGTELTPLDARMQPRVLGSSVDIGAVEWTIDESIVGTDGADSIYGGVGRDTLKGGLGNDWLYGGDGIDTADFSDKTIGVSVNLNPVFAPATIGGEIDFLIDIENLIGGSGDDNFTGNELDNIFRGGLGNDTLNGGLGIDTADYSDKTESVYVDLANHTAQIGSETDGLFAIENIIGGSAGDSLNGDDGVAGNKLEGRGGNDTLSGGAGNDTLDGGKGFDTVSYLSWADGITVVLDAFGNATVNAGLLGIDTFISIEGVEGGFGGDKFTGNASDNYFYGGEGNDTFRGGLGNDTMVGGGLIDTVDYAERKTKVTVALNINGDAKVVFASGETDTLEGIENIIGGSNGDSLSGNASANMFVGNRGDDTFRGGGGQDIIDGGIGSDTADFSDRAGKTIKVTLTGATPTSVFIGGTTAGFIEGTLANVENLIGSDKVDTFTGDSFANTFKGLAGKDVFDGKTGSDTADYSEKTQKVTVTLKTSTAVDVFVNGTATANKEDKIKNIENLIGGSNTDKFTGDKLANTFKGMAGNDTLDGSTGSDTADYSEKIGAVEVTLKTSTSVRVKIGGVNEDSIKNIENIWGGSAGDKLTGDSAANTFRGFAGADTLNGGLGKDTLTGGKDADVFVFNSTLSSSNVDTITDFKPGTDSIQFDDKVFKGFGTTFDFGEFYAAAGAVKGHDLDDRLIYNTTTGKLYYDIDGSKVGGKAAILVATIMDGSAPAALTYSDLQMI